MIYIFVVNIVPSAFFRFVYCELPRQVKTLGGDLDFCISQDTLFAISAINIFHETDLYAEWFSKLRDIKGRGRSAARIESAKAGNFGAYKVLDEGVCEMKIDFGPGYRVYYAQEGLHVYLLIVGGDKSTQKKDIAKARELWRMIREERQ